jgi:cytochrome oxidase Cu insertion factor (SCO1/SenC/PrrC family)
MQVRRSVQDLREHAKRGCARACACAAALFCALAPAACTRASDGVSAARITAAAPARSAVAAVAAVSATPQSASPSEHFPNVVLTTKDNERVLFYDDLIRGKVVLINFMFTGCDSLCPRTTRNLAKVQALLGDRLGRDVFILSISVDPANDTPEALRAYAGEYQVKPGWQFVTGSTADIELIRRKLGVYERDAEQDKDKNQHTGMLIYGNEPQGRWSKLYAMSEPRLIVENVTRWLK